MRGTPTIRVLIVDDHPVVREGLETIVGSSKKFKVVGTAQDGKNAVSEFKRCRPDIVLMDLRMPVMDGLSATREIREIDPHARVIILTTYDDHEDIYRAVKAGASGYMLKGTMPGTLLDSIQSVYEGKTILAPMLAAKLVSTINNPQLTHRELAVLRAMATGLSNKEIGAALDITEGTVKSHVNHILQKLQVESRTAAAHLALERGLLVLEPSTRLPYSSK
jgi:two-component system NarL family response regulator